MKKNKWRRSMTEAGIGLLLVIVLAVAGVMVYKNRILTMEEEECALGAGVSLASGESTQYLYVHDGDNYRYAITADGREVFAFKNEDGTFLDVMAGGGCYMTVDAVTGEFMMATAITNYVETEENGVPGVMVAYQMSDNSNAYNKYIFYEDHVNVEACITGIANSSTVAGAVLHREFMNSYVDGEKKTATSWVFPENGDFPYKVADSIVTTYLFDNEHKLYSFVRGQDGKKAVLFEEYGQEDIPVTVNNNTLSAYALTYDLVFENPSDGRDSDYLALFKGQNAEFAAGITALTQGAGNVTFFNSHELDFNLNITNLKKYDVTTQLDYTVYDYDGNVLADGHEVHALPMGGEQNLPLHIESDKNGIYYIDFSVANEQYSYRELYSFAIMENYTYTYSDSSPFGISGIRFGEYEPNDDTVWIAENIGAANVRVCISEPDYVSNDYSVLSTYFEKMTNSGIQINGQYLLMDGWIHPSRATSEQYKLEISNVLQRVGKYLSSCAVGNEYNLEYNYLGIADAVSEYMASYFDAGYRSIKQENQIDISGTGVGLSRVDWMLQSVEAGLFEKEDILTTHAYGFPYSPDFTAEQSVELVVESAFARTRNFLDQYGDKTWYVDEVGYPTTANSSVGVASGCDLRSQADYTVREVMLALAYGADVVEVYNLYDQLNLFKGVSDTDQEYNFGLFYYRDYYGRIMPKPSSIAFATMTRQLEGIESCKEVETGSDTVRAFEVTLRDSGEKVIVAWSTCYHLSNDIGYDFVRTPNMPWQEQWQQTENVTFTVEGSRVEVIDIMGNRECVAEVAENEVEVTLDGSPKFIRYE